MQFDMFKKPKAKGRKKARKNPGTKAGGRKAAKTRKRNAAKRSTAARKGARTRVANHNKRSRAAKRGAAKRGKRSGRRRTTRRNPTGGVSVARVAKVERKLTQVVKTQHVQGAKITKLSTRVTRLDGSRKALGLPSGGGSLRKAEDLLQDRAVALELAARRKNPKRGKRRGRKAGKRRGRHGKR